MIRVDMEAENVVQLCKAGKADDPEVTAYMTTRRDIILSKLKEQYDENKRLLASAQSKLIEEEQIKREAAALGDRSENAEYQNAVESVIKLTKDISELQAKIRSYESFTNRLASSKVTTGSTVLISNDVHSTIWVLVPGEISDAEIGALSEKAPVGSALLSMDSTGEFTLNESTYNKKYHLWRFI